MARTSRRARTWLVAGVLATLVLVAWGGWGWWSDDQQVRHRFASSVQELDGVQDTDEPARSEQVVV